MSVVIESAGDHGFDLPHLKRSGGEELIQRLLEKAGFETSIEWRVRVNEKQPCSGMTPPVTVIRYKEWGVYLRIKPGDNNTCHNVTLLISGDFTASEVYSKLDSVRKSFNRNWRKAESVIKTSDRSEIVAEVSTQVAEVLPVTKKRLLKSSMYLSFCRTLTILKQFVLLLNF